ncbi:MAG: Yip1 family protein [Hyphomicrobium sp.]
MTASRQAFATSLFEKVKRLLMAPKLEWPSIAAQPETPASLYTGYIIPVAGFGVLCTFLRDLMGYSAFGFAYRPTVAEAIGSAIWMYGLQLAGVFILTLVMEWLAPHLGGVKDRIGALKLAGYSATAAWLSNIFLLIPWLGILTILGLYTLYLIRTGAPVLLKVPENRALQFTASLVGIGIVASLIFYALVAPILFSRSAPSEPGAPENSSSSTAPASDTPAGSFSIPGVGKVDLSKLDDLGKRLESLSSGNTKLPVIPTVDLAELMPISLPGFARTETSTSESIAGLDLASVSAVYANGDNVITLTLSDMGVAGAMASLTGALGVNRTEQTSDTYRKLATVNGKMTMEEYDTKAKIGSYATMVSDRVMIKAEGRGATVEQLKAAVGAVDQSAIEALAKN